MTQWRIRGRDLPSGKISVPGDKSLGHRSILFGALGNGVSRVRGLPTGEDVQSSISIFKSLGVTIEPPDEAGFVAIHGVGLRGLKSPDGPLNCGNSGTTMRLLAGLFSGIPGLHVELHGDESLSVRPMARIVDPLTSMGASIEALGEGSTAPLRIQGKALQSTSHELAVSSAQVKSAILLAALASGVSVRVKEPSLSRDHTERMLRGRGVPIETRDGWIDLSTPPSSLPARDTRVPGDISSAAFFMVLGAIGGYPDVVIHNVGVNPSRTGILDVLKAMGADLSLEKRREEGGEPVASIRVSQSDMRGVTIDGSVIPRCIDEVPILAVAAAFAEGTTRVVDAAELRVKETDRIFAMVTELKKMGVDIVELPDGLEVRGGAPLQGAKLQSYGDHRIAMALAIAALFADGESTIDGAEAAAISFPEFPETLASLVGEASIRVL